MSQDKPRREYISTDPESKKNKSEYSAVLESIERRMDPTSTTVLIVDDEPGIRKFVARGIRRANRSIVIYEAENGQEGLAMLAEIRGNKEHPFNKGPQTAGKAAYNAAHAEVMRLARLISGEGASTKRDSMFAN